MVHEPVNSVCGAGFDERKAGSQVVVGDVHGAQAKAYCLECKFVHDDNNNKHEAFAEPGFATRGLWVTALQLRLKTFCEDWTSMLEGC